MLAKIQSVPTMQSNLNNVHHAPTVQHQDFHTVFVPLAAIMATVRLLNRIRTRV